MILEKQAIRSLVNYQTKEVPYKIKLDANESNNYLFPDGFDLSKLSLQRYPDDQASTLRQALSGYLGVPKENILEGNGSSELIELLLKTYLEPQDLVLTFEPTFSMYRIYTQMVGATYLGLPSRPDFTIDMATLIQTSQTKQPKIIFLCTPNNPTGMQIPKAEIRTLLKATPSLVVVDEAYIEFANPSDSMLDEIETYPNLVILRTFSKAFGLAAIRLGYLIASEAIVRSLAKVKPPYHLNALTQAIGTAALKKIDQMETWVQGVIKRREELQKELQSMTFQTYPATGNFIFVQSPIPALSLLLEARGILIRAYGEPYAGYYRITVGTAEENAQFIAAIKEIQDGTNRN
jgi:histidinol-phosphate aminotransferase